MARPRKQVKSIEEQTGWKRPTKFQILQNYQYLIKVTDYNYNIRNRNFLKYFADRTGIIININDKNALKKDRILKAKLQDCWEIWQNRFEQLCLLDYLDKYLQSDQTLQMET